MPEPEGRPMTVNELRPFFTTEGLTHLDLAITKYRLAEVGVIAQQEKDAADAEIGRLREMLAQAVPVNGDNPLGLPEEVPAVPAAVPAVSQEP